MAILMVHRTSTPDCTGVAPKGPPTSNLDPVNLWNTPPHPVAAIPLEPAAFIGIPVRITEKTVVVVIRATYPGLGGRPAILAPHGKRLTGFDSEQIASFRIGAFW